MDTRAFVSSKGFSPPSRSSPRVTNFAGHCPAQFHTEASRQLLGELPGDAARARAARGRPFQRLPLQIIFCELDAEMRAIASDHRQILILATAVEAEPEPEAVG